MNEEKNIKIPNLKFNKYLSLIVFYTLMTCVVTFLGYKFYDSYLIYKEKENTSEEVFVDLTISNISSVKSQYFIYMDFQERTHILKTFSTECILKLKIGQSYNIPVKKWSEKGKVKISIRNNWCEEIKQ